MLMCFQCSILLYSTVCSGSVSRVGEVGWGGEGTHHISRWPQSTCPKTQDGAESYRRTRPQPAGSCSPLTPPDNGKAHTNTPPPPILHRDIDSQESLTVEQGNSLRVMTERGHLIKRSKYLPLTETLFSSQTSPVFNDHNISPSSTLRCLECHNQRLPLCKECRAQT